MNKKIYFLFILLFLVLAGAIYLHRESLIELDKSIAAIDNTNEVIYSFQNLSGDLETAEMHSRVSLNNTPNNLSANDFISLISDINEIKPIAIDYAQRKRLDTLSELIDNWRMLLAGMNITDTADPALKNKIKNNTLEIQSIVNRCISRQHYLLTERQTHLKKIVKALNRLTILLMGLAFLLVIFTAFYGYKQMKNRIDLEALLESILNASQEGIITCKTCRDGFKIDDFEILFANNAVKTHFGQDPSQLIGKSILYLMPEIRTSGLFAKWIQVVEDGLPDEYEACHKDPITNKDNWYSIKLVKLEDGVTVTFHNITELRGLKQNIAVN